MVEVRQFPLPQHVVQREVPELQHALEQRQLRRHLAPALHLDRRRLDVIEHLLLLPQQAFEPRQQRRLRTEASAEGQGVDEQPDRRLDVFQLARPGGDGDAEDHVGLAAGMAEQQRPHPLGEGVERHPALPRQGLESRRERL